MNATLDPRLSRWLWLVKWILVIPHYVVLAFLWLGFAVTTIMAFFAILITGRYPQAIFTYNVGVLRWSWRVSYYAYGALGTDRYPPFTLDDVPGYPAHLSVDYPSQLSRGLVLVKWWLLALPHYLIVGILLGGITWISVRTDQGTRWTAGTGGIVGILVVIAGVVLLTTGRYPVGLFDVVLGMNRWALRVAGYASLMTDVYPPFRLDRGGNDPGLVDLATPSAGLPGGAPPSAPSPASQRPASSAAWSPGRTLALVGGSLACLLGLALLVGGGRLLAVDGAGGKADGFLSSPTVSVSTQGYALTSSLDLRQQQLGDVDLPGRLLGEARIRVNGDDVAEPLFVGIAPTAAAQTYLADVARTTWRTNGAPGAARSDQPGTAPSTPPGQQPFWVVSSSGPGTRVLSWKPVSGDWTLVVMNASGARNVAVQADAAAEVPALPWVALIVLTIGLGLLAPGALLVGLSIRSASRQNAPAAPGPSGPERTRVPEPADG